MHLLGVTCLWGATTVNYRLGGRTSLLYFTRLHTLREKRHNETEVPNNKVIILTFTQLEKSTKNLFPVHLQMLKPLILKRKGLKVVFNKINNSVFIERFVESK